MIGRVTATVVGNRIMVTRAGKAESESAVVSRHVRTVAIGELVRLFEDRGQLWVVAILGTGPVTNVPVDRPPVPETQTTIRGTEVVGPTWSGTFRNGSWRSDTSHLIQGDGGFGRSFGAAFYGDKLKALGTLTAGKVRVERLSYGTYAVQSPTMRLLAGGKTGSYPATLATAAGPGLGSPGSVGTFNVPGDWLPRLASGEAGGIGVGVDASTPYMRFDGPEFILTVDWERTA